LPEILFGSCRNFQGISTFKNGYLMQSRYNTFAKKIQQESKDNPTLITLLGSYLYVNLSKEISRWKTNHRFLE